MNAGDPHDQERQSILTRLLDSVKQCQVRFGGRTELAADTDSRVSCLCAAWEAALQHGMKQTNIAIAALKSVTEMTGLNKVTEMFSEMTNKETDAVFWQYVKQHLTKHEVERYEKLKHISTDTGKGRAWLRAALNEHSLERYLHMILESDDLLGNFYESWSFLRDQERSSMMPMMAAGLGSILFAITIDNEDLNSMHKGPTHVININQSLSKGQYQRYEEEPRPVIAGEESPTSSTINDGKRKEKKKKKKQVHIVNFDDNDSGTYSVGESYSIRNGGRLSSDSDKQEEDSNTYKVSEEEEKIDSVRDECNNLGPPPVKREASISSVTSETKSYTHSSFSSADFDFSETQGRLVPIAQDGTENRLTSDGFLSTSYDSTESGHRYSIDDGVDIVSAARALHVTQRSTAHSYRTEGDGGNTDESINKDTMSTDELKEAIVTMMMKKDEVEEQNRQLQASLQQEMETSSLLRAEIEEMKHSFAAKQEKENSKYQALQKENELLKHQLRRYVNAVQLLRADGPQPSAEKLGIQLDEPQPSIPPANPSIDYSQEASQYEAKLIQVAEMHGELMEFNEMLHRQIMTKDALLRRLQQELVDLRGPLPRDLQLVEETSGGDPESIVKHFKTLVNVWIPSAFLQGTSSNCHHVYQVYVRIKDEEWNVYRRFSEFHNFHVRLKKLYTAIGRFEFPPKKTIGKKDSKVVESRRVIFQAYLRQVVNHVLEKNEEQQTAVNKEYLINLLPFFSDKNQEKDDKDKKKGMKKASSAASLQSSAAAATVAEQPEYDGS